jgi:hypothetical protein
LKESNLTKYVKQKRRHVRDEINEMHSIIIKQRTQKKAQKNSKKKKLIKHKKILKKLTAKANLKLRIDVNLKRRSVGALKSCDWEWIPF